MLYSINPKLQIRKHSLDACYSWKITFRHTEKPCQTDILFGETVHPLSWILIVINKFCFLGAFTKFRKATVSFVMSVRLSPRLHESNRLSLDGFSLNFIFVYFSKICWENLSFIEIWQEKLALYMKSNILFDHISLNSFQSEKCFRQIRKKNQNTFFCCNFFFSKIVSLMRECLKML